jgi:CIC family chloride channel protein
MREYFRRFPAKTRMFQPAAGGLAMGLMAFWIPEILGVGYSAVDRVLHGQIVLAAIAILLPLKVFGTVVSYASGDPGGIFGPSLFFGAMIGGFVGTFFHQFLPGYTGTAGAYALVGMGATFAGIIRTPMTSVIMIFELTRDYSSIVPLMICNLASYWMAGRLQPTPIYEALAAQEGIQLPKSPERRAEPDLVVRDAMRPLLRLTDPERAVADVPVKDEEEIFVGRNGVLWGVLLVDELRAKTVEAPRSPLAFWISAPQADDQPLVDRLAHVHPDHKIEIVLHRLANSGQKVLPVLDRVIPRRLLGEVTLDDLLRTCRNTPRQMH